MFVEDTTESRLGLNPADPFPLWDMGVIHLRLSVRRHVLQATRYWTR